MFWSGRAAARGLWTHCQHHHAMGRDGCCMPRFGCKRCLSTCNVVHVGKEPSEGTFRVMDPPHQHLLQHLHRPSCTAPCRHTAVSPRIPEPLPRAPSLLPLPCRNVTDPALCVGRRAGLLHHTDSTRLAAAPHSGTACSWLCVPNDTGKTECLTPTRAGLCRWL